jgi:hypothetical protein
VNRPIFLIPAYILRHPLVSICGVFMSVQIVLCIEDTHSCMAAFAMLHAYSYRAQICKPFKQPRNRFPDNPIWRTGPPGGISSLESNPGLLKRLQIRAQCPFLHSISYNHTESFCKISLMRMNRRRWKWWKIYRRCHRDLCRSREKCNRRCRR